MLNVRDLIPWKSGKDVDHRHHEAGHPLMTLHHEIDRLFNDMWRGFGNFESFGI